MKVQKLKDNSEIQMTLIDNYEQLYVNKLEILKEIDESLTSKTLPGAD